ncbi:MAG: hypothetical protein LBK99_16445 [Opitutaceae bacterium]|jgi:hypothetical protein|nr:hypothetical protein [Opitutaceae bacterium]
MNLSDAAFSFSRARNKDGEFATQGSAPPESMARAYPASRPLRARLAGHDIIARIREKAARKAGIAAELETRIQRPLTPVEFATLRQFARARGEHEFSGNYYPASERRTDRTIRNVGIGIGAAGLGYGAYRVGQLAKASQATSEAARQSADAVSEAAREGVKAARSSRLVTARIYRGIKEGKRQLTTFPTFSRIGKSIASRIRK